MSTGEVKQQVVENIQSLQDYGWAVQDVIGSHMQTLSQTPHGDIDFSIEHERAKTTIGVETISQAAGGLVTALVGSNEPGAHVAISATGVVEKAHTFAEQVREIAVKWEELKALIGAAATTGEEIQKGIHTTVTLGKAYIADI